MSIVAVGINHKHTPVEIRERFYLSDTEQDLLLSELKNNPSILEGFVLSTCNRVEVYAHVLNSGADIDHITQLIFSIKKIPLDKDLRQYFYSYADNKAVTHLLRVASSLDSMVIGEKQIIGQLRSAFDRAVKARMFSRHFNILSNIAIRTGKKSHHETNIGKGGSSVSWAAVAKAEEVLGSLQNKSILIIGAGKMSELAVGQIQNKNFRELYLMNRTVANAEHLAKKYGGIPTAFCDIKEILSKVDVSICSVGAPHYILDKATVEKIMPLRDNRPMVMIDISVPRNIDPRVSEVPGVLSFQIDDLEKVVDSNMQIRKEAIGEVEKIISCKTEEYLQKIQKVGYAPDNADRLSPSASASSSPVLK